MIPNLDDLRNLEVSNEWINNFGLLINHSMESPSKELLDQLVSISSNKESDVPEHLIATFYFYTANIWSCYRHIASYEEQWNWYFPPLEKELKYLRLALRNRSSAPDSITCRVLINLGSHLDTIGRFCEAQELFREAYEIDPSFGMSLGNSAYGLYEYCKWIHDTGHKGLFIEYAKKNFEKALELEIEPHAIAPFQKYYETCSHLLEINGKVEIIDYDLGNSIEEIEYRKWCLENNLFLNSLNDLGTIEIAGRDIMTLPSILESFSTGEKRGLFLNGLFNQLKQDLVSSRFLFYSGCSMDTYDKHYSDNEVSLINTLDYPVYGLAVQKMRMAYIMAYSIFDKIAFFLKSYFEESKFNSFNGMWFEKMPKKTEENPNPKPIIKEFFKSKEKNLPLRALFWLSRDLHNDKFPELKSSMEPEAEELNRVRGNLVHEYLKINDMGYFEDPFAQVIDIEDFKEKSLKVLKLARSAIQYLAMAVHFEEEQKRDQVEGIIGEMPLFTLD